MTGVVSLGVAGALGPAAIAAIAAEAEECGFAALWVNDTPGADALDGLAAAARATERIGLATGVVPVDRRAAHVILDDIDRLDVPRERLTLGIGSGSLRSGALDAVATASARLKAAGLPQVVVGALGPRMRRVAVDGADGALLSWLTPQAAAAQSAELHRRRPDTRVALYVRTAVDDAALPRLARETAAYAGMGAYPAHFARLGVDPADTTLRGGGEVRDRLPAYVGAVDEVVLRAIVADDTVEAYRSFARATAPGARL